MRTSRSDLIAFVFALIGSLLIAAVLVSCMFNQLAGGC